MSGHDRPRTVEDVMKLRDYARASAIELAALVRRREVSPVEVAACAIEAIADTDPHVNAYCEVFEGEALARAAELEEEAMRGAVRGALHGVPFAVKDLFNVEGTRTRRGSRIYAGSLSSDTAPAVERMLAAGAILVGKTTMPELGWKASSQSPLHGVTRNPWDPELTPGGSSSGSAAAVADGSVPIALGSDGGGSLRIPASFCGTFSLKATLGRIATHPLSSSEQLSHVGAITRSVADSALALDVLAGPDPRDPNALPSPADRYAEGLDDQGPAIRCAFAPTLFARPVAPDVARCVAAAVDRMRSALPVHVVERAFDWDDPVETFETLWTSRATLYLDLDEHARLQLDRGFARLVELSSRIRVADHLHALQERARFSRRVAESFRDFDVLLMPMLPVEPFDAEDDGPPGMDPSPAVPWTRWTPFSYPFNLTGQPAASIPCGWTGRGLPVGLQVVGRRFEERTVLRFCRLWERAFDWCSRRPRVFAGD